MQQTNRAMDKRRRGRIPARLKVRFGQRTCDNSAVAENISEDGLYINTNKVYPVGTHLEIQIELPGCAIFQRARVVWAIRVPEHMQESMICGMGVEFLGHNPEWAGLYRKWQSAR